MRACTSSNRRAFSMAMTAWSAKVWTSSISRSVKAIGSSRGTPKTPIVCLSPSGAPTARRRRRARFLTSCVFSSSSVESVGDTCTTSSFAGRPGRTGCPRRAARTRWQGIREALRTLLWNALATGRRPSAVKIVPRLPRAETDGGVDQRLQDRIKIEHRPADDLQHVGGRGLLLQAPLRDRGSSPAPRRTGARSRWRSRPDRRRSAARSIWRWGNGPVRPRAITSTPTTASVALHRDSRA